MKKKLFIFVVLSLLFTGCTAQYNLVVDNDSFDESVSVYFPKNDFDANSINGIMAQKTPITQDASQREFYNNSLEQDDYNYIVKESYTHSVSTISNSYLITKCYGSGTIENTEDNFIIDTGNEFGCIYMDDGAQMDSAVINITTDLKVLSNNADEVNDNTYTWKIDKTNYKNKPIKMEIQKKGHSPVEKVVKETTDSVKSNKLTIVCVCLFVASLITVLIIRVKSKKCNKI